MKEKNTKYFIFFFLGLVLIPSAIQCQSGGNKNFVTVRDFGAIPNDGKDDSEGIREAISYAQTNRIKKISFEAGTYDFNILSGWEKSAEPVRNIYLELTNIHHLELVGATDSLGNPATMWLKYNDLKEFQPGIFSMQKGSNITMRNVTVDMAPYYYSAGKVVEKQGEMVTVEILEGHPIVDGQKAFIMGTYDLEKRKIKEARITWDTGLPRWYTVGNNSSRFMKTSHKLLSENTIIGDGVFWFQGNTGNPLLNFAMIESLLLENVQVWNGHGFPLTCQFNTNVTYRNVRLIPVDNRIATTCRDGFKLLCNDGKVVMDNIYIEGCFGDDGQNIHGLWLAPKAVLGEKEMIVYYPVRDRWVKQLTPGKKVRLLNKDFQPAWESAIVASTPPVGSHQKLTFADKLPEWINDSTAVEAVEWLPDTLIIKNSVFRNTGRNGIMPNASNTLIDSCLFEYNNAAIQIGGEWFCKWKESMHPNGLVIRNCTFRDNNLNLHFGGKKMSNAINISTYSTPDLPCLVKNIFIHNNTFIDEGTCVVLKQCENVWFWDNKLINCKKDLVIDEKTTSSIRRTAPDVKSEI